MAMIYILIAILIIIVHYDKIPYIFSLIFSSAFGTHSILGGLFGSAISMGVKRGIYSNEAGQGSAVHAAAAAEVSHPAEQGLIQPFSVYVDTLFVCTATAIIILATGMYEVVNSSGNLIFSGGNLPSHIIENGPIYTQLAINSVLPDFGTSFVAIILSFFAFTTLISYYFQAETNVYFLFQKHKKHTLILNIVRILFIVCMFYTSIKEMQFAWDLADIGVGLMAWTNIIAIVLLQKIALKVFKDFEIQHKQNKKLSFEPKKLGINNAETWN